MSNTNWMQVAEKDGRTFADEQVDYLFRRLGPSEVLMDRLEALVAYSEKMEARFAEEQEDYLAARQAGITSVFRDALASLDSEVAAAEQSYMHG